MARELTCGEEDLINEANADAMPTEDEQIAEWFGIAVDDVSDHEHNAWLSFEASREETEIRGGF